MSDTDLKSRLEGLSPEKRALLFKKLQLDGAKGKPTPGAEAIPRVPRDSEDYPPSFAQQRLWFLYEYEPDSAEYNIPQGFRLRGSLDRELLHRALEALVERHEVLRTSFRDVDSEPRQVIAPPGPVDLPVEDVSGAEDPAAEALKRASDDAQRHFDLTEGPLLRVRGTDPLPRADRRPYRAHPAPLPRLPVTPAPRRRMVR